MTNYKSINFLLFASFAFASSCALTKANQVAGHELAAPAPSIRAAGGAGAGQVTKNIWQKYKQHFGKSYPTKQLDALHETILLKRLEIFAILNEQCKSEQRYKWTKQTDQLRSTWLTYIEPTVRQFIAQFEVKNGRNYSIAAGERDLRHQLIELHLDRRRLLRNCCKLSYAQQEAGEAGEEEQLIDRTREELARMGRKQALAIGREGPLKLRCENARGGPSKWSQLGAGAN